MKLLSIQYLRGIAALSVVLFHVFVQLHRLGYAGPTLDVLEAGVDIFFVISGFIMWYTTSIEKIGALKFLEHRIIRIVPLYWVVTTFYLTILLIKPDVMQSAKFELYHIVASYLFIPALHPINTDVMAPLVIPGWTLNFEMFFYLLFSFGLLFALRTRAVIVVAMLICIVALQALNPPFRSIIEFYSSDIILEFGFGVVLGYLVTTGISIPRLPSILMIVVGCIVLTIQAVTGEFNLPRTIILGIPAFLIVAGAVFYELDHSVVEFGLPKLLGDSSYSLYLSHGAVLSAFEKFCHGLKSQDMPELMFFILFSLGAIVTASIFGICLYRFVERPLLRKLSIHMKQRDRVCYP